MKSTRTFPFERARRISAEETRAARKAIEAVTGRLRPARGRPRKQESIKYRPISIRIHPRVLEWAKRLARRSGVGYQTILNDTLLRHSHR